MNEELRTELEKNDFSIIRPEANDIECSKTRDGKTFRYLCQKINNHWQCEDITPAESIGRGTVLDLGQDICQELQSILDRYDIR